VGKWDLGASEKMQACAFSTVQCRRGYARSSTCGLVLPMRERGLWMGKTDMPGMRKVGML